MSGQTISKLNKLLQDWPKGTVVTQRYLQKYGVSRQLTHRYLKSEWIQRIGRSAYMRAGDTVNWLGALYALQSQLEMDVRVGGVTALSLRGYGQYLPIGYGAVVHLFSENQEKLPRWFVDNDWGVRIQHHHLRLFEATTATGVTTLDRGTFNIRASSAERAILEVIYLATSNAELEHALELLTGLTTLRPVAVQALLEGCRSVKVKRFFLWAAEHAGHNWVRDIETTRIDLGKGKRLLYKGGHMNTKYQITVPEIEGLPDV